MIRPPLFGKDSSPQYTAPRLSCLCTVVICLIFILLMFILPGTKTKKFSEPIRIVLDPLPVQKAQKISEDVPNSLSSNVKSEITNSKPEPSVQESQTPIQNTTPVPKKAAHEPEKAKEVKTQIPVKSEIKAEKEYKKAPAFVPKKSVEELMAEADAARQEKAGEMIENYEENSSVPSNNNSENISSSSQNKIGNPLGTETAATLSDRTKSTQSTKTAGTSNRKPETGDNKSFSTKASGSETSTSFKTTERKSNGILLSMTDGSSRLLISPSDPSISLSEHASNTISEDITVRIIFNISDNGNVPAYGIMISPKLNQTVMNEIISQISKWKFESSFSDSTCSFDFSIRLKY